MANLTSLQQERVAPSRLVVITLPVASNRPSNRTLKPHSKLAREIRKTRVGNSHLIKALITLIRMTKVINNKGSKRFVFCDVANCQALCISVHMKRSGNCQ
ncbi:MAG: hypothetical protein A2Y59_00395 [Chloroflexi bacterium RBG_13_52_14]|nr:MAG: hypothetical protein A2Y59_00395 [Chloroflexi bacterium RBG_13_52_14]